MADQLWRGETSTTQQEHHPFANLQVIEEVAEGVGFYKAFSNMTAVKTDAGTVLIDTGSFHPIANKKSHEVVRTWTDDRINTAIYTHGHVDHAYGLPPFMKEAEAKGWEKPEVVGHECVRHRMERYNETAGYNSIINTRQFGFPTEWPTDPIYPTREFGRTLTLGIGGREFRIWHGKGETDDHAWIFLPGPRVLCTGDFFIWSSPNAGNPQKVQRYVAEWAQALRKMAAQKPLVLLPGHGLPVYGEDRVQEALLCCAEYLESLYRQTIDLMNQGATLDDLIHSVKPPEELAAKPFLQPIYDEPEFVVHTIFRCYGGWYTGEPSELKPSPKAVQAKEIAVLAGGISKLIGRASDLLEAGDMRLACHMIDWAAHAEPESKEVHKLRAKIYGARMADEPSTMSKGVFGAAARDSKQISGA